MLSLELDENMDMRRPIFVRADTLRAQNWKEPNGTQVILTECRTNFCTVDVVELYSGVKLRAELRLPSVVVWAFNMSHRPRVSKSEQPIGRYAGF